MNEKRTCELNLEKVLNVDYDTMYVFYSLIPLTGVQNIIGIKNYGGADSPKTTLIGTDSEMCKIILIKNKHVVYEDEYYYNHYKIKLQFEYFQMVDGCGILDGSPVTVHGYRSTSKRFKVIKITQEEWNMR